MIKRTKFGCLWMATACLLGASAARAAKGSIELHSLSADAVDRVLAATPPQWRDSIESFVVDPHADPARLDEALAGLAEQYPLAGNGIALDATMRSGIRFPEGATSDEDVLATSERLAALNMVLQARGLPAADRAGLVAAVELGSRKLPLDLNKVLGASMSRVAAALKRGTDAGGTVDAVQAAGFRSANDGDIDHVARQAALRRYRRLARDEKILGEQAAIPGYGMLGSLPIVHLPNDGEIARSLYTSLHSIGVMKDKLKAAFPGIDRVQAEHDKVLRRRAFWRYLAATLTMAAVLLPEIAFASTGGAGGADWFNVILQTALGLSAVGTATFSVMAAFAAFDNWTEKPTRRSYVRLGLATTTGTLLAAAAFIYYAAVENWLPLAVGFGLVGLASYAFWIYHRKDGRHHPRLAGLASVAWFAAIVLTIAVLGLTPYSDDPYGYYNPAPFIAYVLFGSMIWTVLTQFLAMLAASARLPTFKMD